MTAPASTIPTTDRPSGTLGLLSRLFESEQGRQYSALIMLIVVLVVFVKPEMAAQRDSMRDLAGEVRGLRQSVDRLVGSAPPEGLR